MEQKLQLCVLVLLIEASLAVWQRMTVLKGQTVDLSCPITNAHLTVSDWKNPEGHIMFFVHKKVFVSPAANPEHYSIRKLSESEFTVSISDVDFKDGGNYTCFHYGDQVTEKTVELTVLDHPKIRKQKHKGRFHLKCSAEANHYPSEIFWKLDHGPEILAHSQVLQKGKKYVSLARLSIQAIEDGVTVTCLVRHPALHTRPLMDFVKIRQYSKNSRYTTSSQPVYHHGSMEMQRTTSWFRHTVAGPSSDSSISSSPALSTQLNMDSASTGVPLSSFTSTDARVSTSYNRGTSERTPFLSSDTTLHSSSTEDWTSVSETPEETRVYNHTERNMTEGFNGQDRQREREGNSSLLVFLVTCLIFALLVVVIFFAIKLRRAHVTWKRENEDSDPSEESNKSKSSQEEKNSQGQRRGLFNTAFTQYVVEEPPVVTSVINTAAMEAADAVDKEQTPQLQTTRQTAAIYGTKETEL